jgi:hypothetical protein
MEYAAIDLHKKESQIRIVLENGGIVEPTDRNDPRSVDDRVLGSSPDADSSGGLNPK